MSKKKVLIFLFLVLALAAFFRFWQITQYPPGLYPDEAMNGNNALEASQTGHYKWFYPENNGREGLYINLLTIPLSIFGNKPWALRSLSALFGILTVLGIYLLTKELFKKERIALFASFFTAVSFWHIVFSRIGFRAIMAPLFLTWSFYLLYKVINLKSETRNTKLTAILGGLLFGLGFHTYIAYRIALLLLLIPFWQLLKEGRKKAIAVFLLGAFISGLPLGLYFLNNPADFFGRTSQISIFSSLSPVKALSINILKTIGMLFYRGDYNWRHNMAGEAQLFWPLGILFLIGIIFAVKKVAQKTKGKTQSNNPKFKILFLLSWLLIMALPVVVSNEGIPHALRSIVLIPPIMIFAGGGLDIIVSKINNWHKKKLQQYPESKRQLQRIKKQLTVLLFLFLLLLATHSYIQYFLRWAPNINTYYAFTGRYVEIGNYLNSLPKEALKYVVVNANGVMVLSPGSKQALPMPAQTVMFTTNTFAQRNQEQKNIYYVLPQKISSISCASSCIVVTLENDGLLREKIKKQIPQLKLSIKPGIEILIKER